jgi:hypothetical protein
MVHQTQRCMVWTLPAAGLAVGALPTTSPAVTFERRCLLATVTKAARKKYSCCQLPALTTYIGHASRLESA